MEGVGGGSAIEGQAVENQRQEFSQPSPTPTFRTVAFSPPASPTLMSEAPKPAPLSHTPLPAECDEQCVEAVHQ